MKRAKLKAKADELWFYFEKNVFTNEGRFSYNTNLVFAFADYVDSASDETLSEFLNSKRRADVRAFRKMLNRGIDLWLAQFSKTMAIM